MIQSLAEITKLSRTNLKIRTCARGVAALTSRAIDSAVRRGLAHDQAPTADVQTAP